MVLKRILRCFELSSGLKINLAKSLFMGFSCLKEVVKPLAKKFAYKVGSLPITYIGLAFGGDPRSKAFWDPIVEKFEINLVGN